MKYKEFYIISWKLSCNQFFVGELKNKTVKHLGCYNTTNTLTRTYNPKEHVFNITITTTIK